MLAIYIPAYILLITVAWLIGSTNFAIIIYYWKKREDIRTKFSKNPGGSNVGRSLNKRWGILVVVLDMLKVPLTMFIALGFSFIKSGNENITNFWQVISFYLIGGLVLLGHVWPVFFQFKGGKGVACFWGLTWVTNPWLFLIFAVLWFAIYFGVRKVFFASIGSIFITAVCAWIPAVSGVDDLQQAYSNFNYLLQAKFNFIWFNQLHRYSTPQGGESLLTMQLVITICAIIICLKHRSNLRSWYQKKIINKNNCL